MTATAPLAPALRQRLTDALAALPAPEALRDEEGARCARRLKERVTRDLLPRLSAEGPTLLAGIAGPNNVGKSSLFNALVGSPLSPARPEGGLTKQCLAAANPSLWEGPLRALVEQRYEVVQVPEGAHPPVTQSGPPGRLYLALLPSMPEGVLLMDTPDFDSIYTGNRLASEALLVTVDVLLFVVSRQTYQNAALVQFLKDAVGHGRPYVLVYNEASREEVAREHLAKLAADLGVAPLARYVAGHQPEVERGDALLATAPLDGAAPLHALLAEPGSRGRVKAQALAASLQDAKAELLAVADALQRQAQEPDRLRGRLRHELRSVGEQASRKSVPADVLIEAFQDELDARSAFNRLVRRGVRRVVGVLAFMGRKVRDSFTGEPKAREQVREVVERAAREGLRAAIDSLAPEVASWRGDEATREKLAEALGPAALARLAQADAPLLDGDDGGATPKDRDALYAFCRQLVAAELTGDEREQLLQAATTLVYALPVTAAGALSYVTGGLGQDAAVWISAAVATPVLQKLVDLLGADLRDDVTRRWVTQHGATLAGALERALFAPLLLALDAQVEQATAAARALREAAEGLS